MAHAHSVYDTDTHFIIDKDTRKIICQAENPPTLAQYDHNSAWFTFEVPFVDGHNMALCNAVRVHFDNVDSATKEMNSGVDEAQNLKVSDADPHKITCSWEVSENATQKAGKLKFKLEFLCIDEDGTVAYRWSTAMYEDVTIAAGSNNSGEVVETYSDTLSAWEARLFGIGDTEEQRIKAAIEAKGAATLESIPDDYTETHAMAALALQSMANAIKGNVSGEIVAVNDVSTVEHEVGVKVHGKNLFDYTNIAVVANYQKFTVAVEKGKEYTVSSNIPQNDAAEIYFNGDFTDVNGVWDGRPRTFVAEANEMYIAFQDRGNLQFVVDGTYYVQLEQGSTATEYTPYIAPEDITVIRYGADENDNAETFTPNADGTVLGVTSLSPNMTLLTDTAGAVIDCEYIVDTKTYIDKKIAELMQS